MNLFPIVTTVDVGSISQSEYSHHNRYSMGKTISRVTDTAKVEGVRIALTFYPDPYAGLPPNRLQTYET